jgi:hypothetical protein
VDDNKTGNTVIQGEFIISIIMFCLLHFWTLRVMKTWDWKKRDRPLVSMEKSIGDVWQSFLKYSSVSAVLPWENEIFQFYMSTKKNRQIETISGYR